MTGYLLLVYGVGAILGPMINSNVVAIFGINAILLLFAAFLFILSSVGMNSILRRRRPVVPLEEQTEFVPLLARTPIANEMDPRQSGST
jgi:hypothetical protein